MVIMAYGCKATCDNCRPKYVYCDECGTKNFLVLKACKKCGAAITEDARERAVAQWQKDAATREVHSCFTPASPTNRK